MKNHHSPFISSMIAYYGLIQAAHIIALSRSYILFRQSGEITFLAQPPPGGWSAQAAHFLIGLGAIDAVNAILAWVFVYGYFTQARWWPRLGTTTLTVSVVSALVYGYGTAASGGWRGHMGEYLILVILFLPVAVLAIIFGIWGIHALEEINLANRD
jgi:hypothetical protein